MGKKSNGQGNQGGGNSAHRARKPFNICVAHYNGTGCTFGGWKYLQNNMPAKCLCGSPWVDWDRQSSSGGCETAGKQQSNQQQNVQQ